MTLAVSLFKMVLLMLMQVLWIALAMAWTLGRLTKVFHSLATFGIVWIQLIGIAVYSSFRQIQHSTHRLWQCLLNTVTDFNKDMTHALPCFSAKDDP